MCFFEFFLLCVQYIQLYLWIMCIFIYKQKQQKKNKLTSEHINIKFYMLSQNVSRRNNNNVWHLNQQTCAKIFLQRHYFLKNLQSIEHLFVLLHYFRLNLFKLIINNKNINFMTIYCIHYMCQLPFNIVFQIQNNNNCWW